jgi:hypothetical protein
MFKLLAKVQLGLYGLMFAGVIGGGILVYSKVNSLTSPVSNTIQSGKEFIASVAPNKEQKSEFVLSDFVNTLTLENKLKVGKILSTGTVSVTNTGSRDTWIIGRLLEGKGTFVYSTKFSGYVEYDLTKRQFQVKDDTIVVTLPVPTVYATDIVVRELNASGNLANIDSEKNTVLSGLNSEASRAFFYSQYFTDQQKSDLFNKSFAEASRSITESIYKPFKLLHPNNEIKILVLPTPEATSEIQLDYGTIKFDTVLNSSPLALQDFFKKNDPNVKVTVDVKNAPTPN